MSVNKVDIAYQYIVPIENKFVRLSSLVVKEKKKQTMPEVSLSPRLTIDDILFDFQC